MFETAAEPVDVGVLEPPDMGAAPDVELAERVASLSWYHTLQLPGDVLTPGNFDTANELARVPFPESLHGMRCLDVATADGFWAFEMERRGAAEVVAIDVCGDRLDWPGNAASERVLAAPQPSGLRGFDVAHKALGSAVQWRELSAYALNPATVGEFDFVFIGSVLMHLRDPVAALESVASVLRGELLSVDAISPRLTLMHPKRPVATLEAAGWPLWWVPNLQAYRHLFAAAGLDVLASGRPFFVKRTPEYVGAYIANGNGNAGGGGNGNGNGDGSVNGNDSGNGKGNGRAGREALSMRLKQAALARLGNLHAWVRASTV
jgi:tRNA (mo5U34)-methyltransferase